MKDWTVGILGATGLVGSHLIKILEERKFPVRELRPLASQRSAGATVQFKGSAVPVAEITAEAFNGMDILLASAGGTVSETWVPEAVKRGVVVIDNTSFFRMKPQVPLVVAGVNDEDIRAHRGVIANPNCSTAQLMPVLHALHQKATLKRVIVSTYQSVSGAGGEAMQELWKVCQDSITDRRASTTHHIFPRPIGFNLIPHIDTFVTGGDCDGYTREEVKLIEETRKILHLPGLPVTATAVRVPVMVGHSESLTLEFERPLSPEEAMEILKRTPDVVVSETPEGYPTPLETAGTDPVYVGRIRRDTSNPQTGLNLWIVADNLRIGAALNAVRIAELLVRQDCVRVPSAAFA